MKKIFLIIIILHCYFVNAQSAERRQIDMMFKIETPEDGHYFKLPAIVNVKIKATNLGPDTLCEGDTLYYGIKISTQTRRLLIYKVNRKILPGEYTIISDTITFNDRPSPPWSYNYGTTAVEIYSCFAWNNNSSVCKPINPDYDMVSGRNLNNLDTHSINYTNSQSSTLKISKDITIFPQPFNSEFNIRYHSEIKEVVIKDVLGRVLFNELPIGKKSLRIVPQNLREGLYYLQITDLNGQTETFSILKGHE